MSKKWTERDWIWTVSILIGIIIIILTWRLNDNDSVVNVISMFSSGASIILAIVAIVQSTMYNNSSNELNAKMTEKLSNLETNVSLVRDELLKNVYKTIDESGLDEKSKEEVKEKLNYNINIDPIFTNNSEPVFKSYLLENEFLTKIKRLYSNQYSIEYSPCIDTKTIIDFKFENPERIVFVNFKVAPTNFNWKFFKRNLSSLKLVEKNINENKDVKTILIVVVKDNLQKELSQNYIEEYSSNQNIIVFTEKEIKSKDIKLIEEKTKEYFD